jgi:hypothetical protein
MNQNQQPQQPQQPTEITSFPQAMQLLVDGIQIAQKRGAYSLEESALLFKGIQFLKKSSEEAQKAANSDKLEKIEEM